MAINKTSTTSRAALLAAAILLIISIFVPVWQIDLDAPQYPEGLRLQIWANKIAGDVDIINGLNHYIGMKTLHTEDFIEFTLLPYIIISYSVLFLFAAINGSRAWLNISFVAFVVFGIVAMIDFWKWEYDYGHNLDPNAAIRVPGMAYQPPLIGFKQLLNFGAYSFPSTGGWLFVAAGALLLIVVLKENGLLKKRNIPKNRPPLIAALFFVLLLSSCGSKGPEVINLNTDGCDFCRMTISDGKYAAEIITKKGRVYKFDDISCMLQYASNQKDGSISDHYISDYSKNNHLVDAVTAWYVRHDELKSPMGGNTAAFTSKEAASSYADKLNVQIENWSEINKQSPVQHSNDGHGHQH